MDGYHLEDGDLFLVMHATAEKLKTYVATQAEVVRAIEAQLRKCFEKGE